MSLLVSVSNLTKLLFSFFTGSALTDHEMTDLHYDRITSLQRATFKNFKDDLLDFSLSNIASVDTRESLTKCFGKLRYD